MNIFKKEDLIFKHSKYIKYANVVFDKKIYKKRDFIINFLKKKRKFHSLEDLENGTIYGLIKLL